MLHAWRLVRSAKHLVKTRAKLQIYRCDATKLDEEAVKELYMLWCQHVTTKLSWKDFHHGLILKYNEVTALRESFTGTLQGFSLHKIVRNKVSKDGTKYTLIPQAAAYVSLEYRKSSMFFKTMLKVVGKEQLLHPFTPIYLGWRILSVKGYILAVRMLNNFYPNYKNRTPTELEKSIMDDYARNIIGERETYDSERGIICQEDTVIKDELADKGTSQNPHVNFFYEMNPNSHKGHQLCLVTKVTWSLIFKWIIHAYMLQKLKT